MVDRKKSVHRKCFVSRIERFRHVTFLTKFPNHVGLGIFCGPEMVARVHTLGIRRGCFRTAISRALFAHFGKSRDFIVFIVFIVHPWTKIFPSLDFDQVFTHRHHMGMFAFYQIFKPRGFV